MTTPTSRTTQLLEHYLPTKNGRTPAERIRALAGKALGAQWHSLEKYFAPVAVIAGIAALAVIAWWLWQRRSSAAQPVQAGEPGKSDRLD